MCYLRTIDFKKFFAKIDFPNSTHPKECSN